MTVTAVGAVNALPALAPISTSDTTGPSTSGADFGAMVAQGLQQLQQVQQTADDLAVQAATGRLTDVHDYMIAATEANLATSLTVAVRNKALESFNEIMRMQA
ncbi:flagellar hook-basal body complex protein FliE [Dactylosporangium cerinum]|uniref:Flagellar hook-basal body complex protein FliE n=1 Tax=Dactylosporangium cerinum TaxID=1434730 RepID=A0ABV9W1B9_9ACTN